MVGRRSDNQTDRRRRVLGERSPGALKGPRYVRGDVRGEAQDVQSQEGQTLLCLSLDPWLRIRTVRSHPRHLPSPLPRSPPRAADCRQCRLRSRLHSPRPSFAAPPPPTLLMNSQDAWRRLSQQLQRVSTGGGGGGPRLPVRGFFTGSGLLLALVGGGLALNASLFNGTHPISCHCELQVV